MQHIGFVLFVFLSFGAVSVRFLLHCHIDAVVVAVVVGDMQLFLNTDVVIVIVAVAASAIWKLHVAGPFAACCIVPVATASICLLTLDSFALELQQFSAIAAAFEACLHIRFTPSALCGSCPERQSKTGLALAGTGFGPGPMPSLAELLIHRVYIYICIYLSRSIFQCSL